MTRHRAGLGLVVATHLACSGAEPLPAEPRAREPNLAGASEPLASAPTPATTPTPPTPAPTATLLHPPLTSGDLLAFTGDDAGLRIAVGVAGTILRSTDRGDTWSVIPSGTSEVLRAAWRDPTGPILAVGDAGVVLRSTDAGARWSALDSGTATALHHVSGNAAEVYAAGEAGTILRSRDHGASWERIAMPALAGAEEPRPVDRSPRPVEFPAPPHEPTERELVRAEYSADAPIVGLGTTAPGELFVLLDRLLWRTGDGGTTWAVVTRLQAPRDRFAHLWVGDVGGPRLYVTGRNVHGPAADYFVGLGRGGEAARIETWAALDLRLIRPPVVTAMPGAAGASPRVLLAGDGYAVHWSTDEGATWSGSEQSAAMQSPYGLGKRALWIAADGEVFAAGSAGALMRSGDAGRTWTLLDGDAREPLFGGALSPDGTAIYAAAAHAVLRGAGERWALLGPSTPEEGTTSRRGLGQCCTDVWVAPDGAIVAAGQGGLWRSTDGGVHWTEPRLRNRDACCWSLWGDATAVHGIDRDVVVSSTDGGDTWRSVSLRKLLRRDDGNRLNLAGHGEDLYAVGEKGIVLHSRDRGHTWAREDSGTTEPLHGAWAGTTLDGASVAYVVGEHGLWLRSLAHCPWTAMPPVVPGRLLSVHGDARTGALFLAGDDGVQRSRDDGATWTAVSPGHRSLQSLFGDGEGRVFALGPRGEVLRIEP